jgi:protein-S-isoprenylcysteine O-methyltransferase Ste14
MDVIGVSLLTANWFVLATGIGAFLLIVVRTRIEERNLLARFGEEYQRYRDRTGKFLPRSGT